MSHKKISDVEFHNHIDHMELYAETIKFSISDIMRVKDLLTARAMIDGDGDIVHKADDTLQILSSIDKIIKDINYVSNCAIQDVKDFSKKAITPRL